MIDIVVKYDNRFILYALLATLSGLSQGFHVVTQHAIMIKNNKNKSSKSKLYVLFIALTAGISIMLAPFYISLATREFYTTDGTKLNVEYSITSMVMSIVLLPIMACCVFMIQESNYMNIVLNAEAHAGTIGEYIIKHGWRSLGKLLSANIVLYIACAFVCSVGTTFGLYNLSYYAIKHSGNMKITTDSNMILLAFILFFIAKVFAIFGSVKLKLHFLYDDNTARYITWISTVFFMAGYYIIQNSLKFSLKEDKQCSGGLNPMTLCLTVMGIEKILSYIIFNNEIVPTLRTQVYNNEVASQASLRSEANNTKIIAMERERIFDTLEKLIPRRIAQALVSGTSIPPKEHPFTIVFFSDIEKFTEFCDKSTPLAVFSMINRLFSVIDYCKKLFPTLIKIETAGDSYMCVGGLDGCKEEHEKEAVVNDMLMFALLVSKACSYVQLDETKNVKMRIGMHCGEMATGVTGTLMPHQCCFGDTVNVASRMETNGDVSRLHISSMLASVVKRLPNSHLFSCTERETPVEIKGKGLMTTYWVEPSENLDLESIYADNFAEIREMIAIMMDNTSPWKIPQPKLLRDGIVSDCRYSEVETSSTLPSFTYQSLTGFGDKAFDFSELSQVGFNVMDIDSSDHYKISHLIMKMMEGMVTLEAINVEKVTLYKYIRQVSTHYNLVPFHSYHHSFCVVQFTTALLNKCNINSFLTPWDIFGLLVSALVHDVDHPGFDNSYAIKTSSNLAILYNNESVNERHSIALSLSLMSSEECNLVKNWNTNDRNVFRNLVTQCILSTDMKCHDVMVNEISEMSLYSGTRYFSTNDTARISLCRFILHGADISNSVRPFFISFKISQMVAEEFRMQAKQEAERGVEITPFMLLPDERSIAKNEIRFLKNVAQPYWTAMGLLFDELKSLAVSLQSNLDNWSRRLNDHQNSDDRL